MRKHVHLLTLVLLASLMISACGAGGGQGSSTHLSVQMTEFQFQPSSFTVPAGEEITLDASNNGAIEHNFVIMNKGTQVTSPFDADDESNVYWQVAVSPGESTSTSFTAPSDPGDYQVVCKTAGHVEAGMIGNLTVVSP